MLHAMLVTYRKGMAPDELRASHEREERFLKEFQEKMERRATPVFSPDYNPTTNPRPAQLDDVLATYTVERQQRRLLNGEAGGL